MTQISAYINFNGTAREAMTFYKECIGGELNLQPVAGSPYENQCPASMKERILHATLLKDDLLLMASDMTGPDGYVKGNNVILSLDCSSEEETHRYFNKLAAGGKINHELAGAFWGGLFGAITDKFGISWIFSYDQNIT